MSIHRGRSPERPRELAAVRLSCSSAAVLRLSPARCRQQSVFSFRMDSPVVIDLGSSAIRVGYAAGFPNEHEPRVVTPAAVRVLPPGSVPPGGVDPSAAAAGGGELLHPIRRGVVESWEGLESLLHYALYTQLGWVAGEEGSALVAEPVLTSRDERERLAQLMFEQFNVSGYFVSDQAVLSLYSLGKLSGVAVDVGYEKIDVSAVLDGQLQPAAALRLPYGGRQLSELLAKLLAARGVAGPSAAAVDDLKAACVRVAESGEEAAGSGAGEPSTHTLPDGQTITVGREGVDLGEALFDPARLGLALPPLAEAVLTAATCHAEKETRKALIENIFLCGGGGSIPGAGQRLLRELRATAHPSLSPALCSVPEYMPEHAVRCASWFGGAVLSKVVFQQGQHVTKGEYEEAGPMAVHRRCS